MLDANPAPSTAAPALPHLAPALPDTAPAISAASAIVQAAKALLPVLETGHALDATTLRQAMTDAFGASDAQGAWVWKDAYEAAEAALVLFLQRYGRAMRRDAGHGAGGPAAMLRMLKTLAALEPSQTRRSEDQLRLQQFSTPLPIAYAAIQAAAIRPGDVVLEPSAGTGMLAVMAQCALGPDAAGSLHLNELAATRAGILQRLFPGAAHTRHNAENLRDHMPKLRPTVVIMNPPFSASPGIDRIRHHADLNHIRSAFSMLPPGGRLVTLSSAHCSPHDAPWTEAFASLDPPARLLFSTTIDGGAYARRGTNFTTRLTVLDRGGDEPARMYAGHPVKDAGHLLQALTGNVPARRPIEPIPGADLFGPAPAAPPARTRPRSTAETTVPVHPHDWGTVSHLRYNSINGQAPTTQRQHATGPYTPWQPLTIDVPGAATHPTPLVQSGAMAAVAHPLPGYRPMLPERVIGEAQLSDAQLESVVLAGQAHSGHLAAEYRIGSSWEVMHRVDREHDSDEPEETVDDAETFSDPVRFRRGWMLGDGTGCGKGRQVAGVILDQWLKGRKRALWLSQSDKLLEDARRDWCALGGSADHVIPLGKVRQGARIPHTEGILFTTYATLRSPERQGKCARLDQIVAWLAGGEDEEQRHAYQGVIVFDEAHAMANAAGTKSERGDTKPSQQGRAGLRLQNALPDARILYVSATGATTVPGLAYAQRLGLWASGETSFETRTGFVAAMEAGGVAAMEVVARDLKALGLYQARALSYDGVEVDILEHPLTDEQRRIYDSYASAFKIIHQNIQEALKATGIVDGDETLNKNAKGAALSAFEGAKQRFFGHLLTSMKCPSLLRAIEADLDAGHAAVVQLVSTGEALMERRISEIPSSEWDDLSIDLTPREYVLDFLQHAFPVQLQEPYTNDEGHLLSRPVFDADNNPVLCQEAIEKRDALIQKLGALPPVQAALDQIVHHFGDDAVAEITGRSRRILRVADAKGERLALRSRPGSANLAETSAFMDGDKRILVFSMAGGIGRSYHADLGCANAARRIHYLLEPGWRADQAIQGLGRTHRTHQASAPLFRPVTTDVKGERRFIATIARRLDSLGAITRGQRDSQTAMGADDTALFRASDNLESLYAKSALRQFYLALWQSQIPGWSLKDFEEATGLKLAHEGGLKEDLPPMPQFLNRLLALPIDEQNQLFGALETRIEANIEIAIEAGTFERGVETITADSLSVSDRETVFTHDATAAETEMVEIARKDRLEPLEPDSAIQYHTATSKTPPRLVVNDQSKRAALVVDAASRTFDDGSVQARIRLVRPASRDTMPKDAFDASHWRPADEAKWRAHWDAESASLPSHRESRFWLVAGLLLPIWDRLPKESMRVRRLVADDGEHLIGRVLTAAEVADVRSALGLSGQLQLTPEEVHDEIMAHGASFTLANGWKLARRRLMGAFRIEIHGPTDADTGTLKRMGCMTEIVSWRTRVFAPDSATLQRLIERWPLSAPEAA